MRPVLPLAFGAAVRHALASFFWSGRQINKMGIGNAKDMSVYIGKQKQQTTTTTTTTA
jgi:hypothetical protein